MLSTLTPKRLAVALILGAGSLAADALDLADPFATAAMMPPRPALSAGGDDAAGPCRPVVGNGPFNLVELVDLALCNNPQTREAWANSRAAAAQVGVAEAAYLPSLGGNLAARRDWSSGRADALDSRNVGLTMSYLLYDFGGRDADLESARQLLAAAAATQDNSVQSVFLATVQAYYQVQATGAALDANREAERSARAAFEAASARHAVGAATIADKLQAETALSQTILNRIRIEGELKNFQGNLANAIGRDAQKPLRLAEAAPLAQVMPPPDFERDIDRLVEEARRRRPDLRAAEAQARAAEASVESVRAAGRPTISLAASGGRQEIESIGTNVGSLGVSVNLPLFGGFAPTYRIRAAEAQAEVRAAQLERVRLQVALDVWTGYQNLVTTTQSVRSAADLLASAAQSERVALGRYKAGVGSILDTLSAQSALASARQQQILASFNWNIARATLAQAMGSLDLGLLQELAAATPAAAPPVSAPSATVPSAGLRP